VAGAIPYGLKNTNDSQIGREYEMYMSSIVMTARLTHPCNKKK